MNIPEFSVSFKERNMKKDDEGYLCRELKIPQFNTDDTYYIFLKHRHRIMVEVADTDAVGQLALQNLRSCDKVYTYVNYIDDSEPLEPMWYFLKMDQTHPVFDRLYFCFEREMRPFMVPNRLNLTHTVDIMWLPTDIVDQNDQVKKQISDMKRKIEYLKEILDRPGGIGCRFGYDQIARDANGGSL